MTQLFSKQCLRRFSRKLTLAAFSLTGASLIWAVVICASVVGSVTGTTAWTATQPKHAEKPTSAAAKPESKKGTGMAGFTCSDVRRAALRLSAHASNLANINTTHSPSGGVYRPLEVTCQIGGAFCSVEPKSLIRRVYDPSHADADKSGYVEYPIINPASEAAGFNTAAAELKLLATDGVCGTRSIESGSLVIVKYHPDFEVTSDTIQFGPNGRVDSWTRQNREGKMQSFAFTDDGKIRGL